jgi:WD40 repeat protein
MPDENQKPTDAKDSAFKVELLKEHSISTAVLGLDLFPDDKRAVVACMDGGVYEIDLESGAATPLAKHDSYASSVSLLPSSEGQLAISAGYDGKIIWHELTSKKASRNIAAHKFWSWQSRVSPDGKMVASVSGQYLCGGYKYEPAAPPEPPVKIFNTAKGELLHAFDHLPPVQSLAFSPDSKYLGAGNLMGDIRIWELATGKQLASWNTPSFTGWGIIKGHYYTGGIFALMFAPDGKEIYAAGMGTTTDPAAGNGKQLWQKFAWTKNPTEKISETKEGEHGAGLMESLAWHPSDQYFVMAGRLFQGKWNTAFFDATTGSIKHSLDAKMRVTHARFTSDGKKLILAGASPQEKKKDGKYPNYGRVKIYSHA